MRLLHKASVAVTALTFAATAAFVGGASPAAAASVTTSASVGGVSLQVTYSDTTLVPDQPFTVTMKWSSASGFDQARYFMEGIGYQVDLIYCDSPDVGFGPCTWDPEAGFSAERINKSAGTHTLVAYFQVRDDPNFGNYPLSQTHRVSYGSYETTSFSPGVTLTFLQPPPPPTSADVSTTLTAEPVGLGLLSGAAEYTATIHNAGPATATNAVIRVALPYPRTTSVDGLSSSCSYNGSNDVVTCNVGNGPPGDTGDVNFVANFGPLAIGQLDATSTVSSDKTDPVPGNNTATATCTVLVGLIVIC